MFSVVTKPIYAFFARLAKFNHQWPQYLSDHIAIYGWNGLEFTKKYVTPIFLRIEKPIEDDMTLLKKSAERVFRNAPMPLHRLGLKIQEYDRSILRFLRFHSMLVVAVVLALPILHIIFYDMMVGNVNEGFVRHLTRHTGEWGVQILLLSLMVTPLRRLTHWNFLAQYRRMLGLFAFFYITLHVILFLGLTLGFNWGQIYPLFWNRPAFIFGVMAFILLIPLAVTSTNAMMRRLGGRKWQKLHRTVYIITHLTFIHYFLQPGIDKTLPIIYVLIWAVLYLMRQVYKWIDFHDLHPEAFMHKHDKLHAELMRK